MSGARIWLCLLTSPRAGSVFMEARRADLSRFVIRKSMTSGSDADGGHPSAGCVMATEPLEPNGAGGTAPRSRPHRTATCRTLAQYGDARSAAVPCPDGLHQS